MSIASLLYGAINLMCVLLTGFEFIFGFRGIKHFPRKRYLLQSTLFAVIAFFFDMMNGFGNIYYAINPAFGFVIMCGFHICLAISIYFWFIFSEISQEAKYILMLRNRLLLFLPIILIIILCLTGRIFSCDHNGYQVGDCYFIQAIILGSMFLFSGIKAVIKSINHAYFAKCKEYCALVAFAFIPLFFGVLQLIIGIHIPLLSMGITFCYVIIYQTDLSNEIFRDPLTSLNNRNALVEYLSNHLNDNPQKLCLFMIDVDRFKQINDKYGHLEGDLALIQIADVLRKSMPRNFHIARYAGDEFVLAGEAESETDLKDMVENIQRELKIQNQKNGKEWDVYLSIGYAVWNPQIRSIAEFIDMADKEMYRVKKESQT